MGSPHSWACKESACNVGDLGSIPGLGISPWEGKGYPLQYSVLENSKDCIVHGVSKSPTQLSNFHFHLTKYEFIGMLFRYTEPCLEIRWNQGILVFLGSSVGKDSTCHARDPGSIPGLGRIPWGRKWHPTLVFLPGKIPWSEEPGELQSDGFTKDLDTT